jgi:hypothetical protein
MLMTTASKPAVGSVIEGKPLPIATFKNSLRAWLVRWKAARINPVSVAAKAHNQTAPG